MSKQDYVAVARQYVDNVISGAVPACLFVRQACARSVKDLSRQNTPEFPYVFDEARAVRVCRFMESLPHIQGALAGEHMTLQPWQCWLLCEIFGWLRVGTQARRYRRAYAEMGRGNGKTFLAAGIALYCAFAEGEGGADCIATATCREQARLALDTARQMLQKNEKLAERLGVEVLAHKCEQKRTNSKLHAMPANNSIEGASLHLGILDEVWAARGRTTYDSLSTATAKRSQSLLFCITTAGFDSTGVYFELRNFVERLLSGDATDESFFGVVYTVDADDAWDDIRSAALANPNWGISVLPSVVEEEMRRAQQIPSQQATYRSKYLCEQTLNVGEEPYIEPLRVRACYQDKLDESQFAGQPCVIGLDLASRLDLCATVRVHARRDEKKRIHYYAFCKTWLPEASVATSKNAALRGWAARGDLVITPGNLTDLDVVESYMAEEMRTYKVRDIGFDPLQSNQLVSHLQKQFPNVVFGEVQQFAKFLTQGMTELSEACADGRLHFSSPVLSWCLQNLRGRQVGMGLTYPTRPKDKSLKIDAAVALVMALRSVHVTPLDESRRSPRCMII
jgi:phage terminase large subunit-like protein